MSSITFKLSYPYALANGALCVAGFVVAGLSGSVIVLPVLLSIQIIGMLAFKRLSTAR